MTEKIEPSKEFLPNDEKACDELLMHFSKFLDFHKVVSKSCAEIAVVVSNQIEQIENLNTQIEYLSCCKQSLEFLCEKYGLPPIDYEVTWKNYLDAGRKHAN